MPETLTLEQVMGGKEEEPVAEKPAGKRVTLSVEEVMAPKVEAKASGSKLGISLKDIFPINDMPGQQIVEEDEGDAQLPVKEQLDRFSARTGKTVSQFVKEVERDPGALPSGVGVALIGGLVSMGTEIVAGAQGLYAAASGEGVRGAQQVIKKTRKAGEEVKGKVLGALFTEGEINSPVAKKSEAVIGQIPDAVKTFSDTTYKVTENLDLPEPVRQAAAGAAFAVGTYATMVPKPFSRFSKTEKSLPPQVKNAAEVGEAALADIVMKDPEAARAMAEKAKEVDVKLGEKISERVEEIAKGTPEQLEALGEKIVEAGFQKVGETATGKPRVRATAEKPAKALTPEEQIKANEKRIQELEQLMKDDAAKQKIAEEGLSQTSRDLANSIKSVDKDGLQAMGKNMADAITGNLYEGLFAQLQKGSMVMAGVLDPLLVKAKPLFEQGKIKTVAELKDFANSPYYTAPTKAEMLAAKGSSKKTAVKEVIEDPVAYREDTGQAITESQVKNNFTYKESIPIYGADFIVGKMKAYFDQIRRLIAPESLGQGAKTAAAVVAKAIAEQMRKDVFLGEKSKGRVQFWEKNQAKIKDFIDRFEKGQLQLDPLMQQIDYAYAQWNKRIYQREKALGIKYEAVDNYLYHVFEDGPGLAQFFERKYGPRWNQPGFVKDRAFNMYREAEAAGFKPKYRNPEEIMLAREHASAVAEMRIQTLNDLKTYGLAKEITKADSTAPQGWNAVKWKSPNGTKYWVHDHAAAILHNAFETKTLWNVEGILGDAFRGAMFLKNIMVSALLSLSGFHALHVLTLDNATNMVRSSKEMLSGKKNPIRWLGDFIEANLYGSKGIPLKALYDNPAQGGRLIKAYEGKIDPAQLTLAERTMLNYMTEGGFIPHLSVQYKTSAIQNFKKAIRDRDPVATTFWTPFAAIQLLQKPMMEIWIPRLKAASYSKDIQTALKTDPTLLQDTQRRSETFRKLAKSVDNRYGEMAYNTLFWNRMIKDIGVANTLSLGWQLGFIREYGGGMMDVGQFVKPGSSLKKKVETGLMDRPLFLTFYTTQSLLYGGLMTYALTGAAPETLEDYIFPKNGEKNPDGTDQRVSTMYYVKEFASISKRMQIEGPVAGMKHVVESKASGVVGAVGEWVTGLNSMGQEIRDPNAPMQEQLRQSLAYTLQRIEPISAKSVRESDRSLKSTVMGVAGFSPAPKYIADSVTEGKIKKAYQTYNTGKQVPYEKYLLSKERRELERLYEAGEMEQYDQKLEKVIEKFELTEKEQAKLTGSIGNKEEQNNFVTMFKSLPWQRQKNLLDQMTEQEREIYLPVSNKDHLRDNYEPPEEN